MIHSPDLCAIVAANTTGFEGALHSPGWSFACSSGINCKWKISVIQPAQGIMIHLQISL